MPLFYLLVVVMPLSEHHFWARDFGASITPFKILGAACIGYAAFRWIIRGRPPALFATTQAKIFVALYAIVVIQCIANPGPRGANAFLHWSSFFLLFLLSTTLISSMKRLRWTLYAAAASVAVASAYILRSWIVYRSVYDRFRPGGATGDPNYFALAAVCFLPLSFWMIIRRRRPLERLFWIGCSAIGAAAFAVASSRGGLLGLAGACGFVVLKQKHRVRNLLLASIVLIPLSLLPGGIVDRMLHPAYGDEVGIQSRFATWNAALNMISAHPLFGIGPGYFRAVVGQFQTDETVANYLAHNTYLELGAELGLPTLVLYVVMGWATYKSLSRTRRRAAAVSPYLYDVTLGIQAGLIASAIAMFFLTAAHQKGPWFLIFLSLPLRAAVARARLARRGAVEARRAASVANSDPGALSMTRPGDTRLGSYGRISWNPGK